MTPGKPKRVSEKTFLEELHKSFDLEETLQRLDLTSDEARRILKSAAERLPDTAALECEIYVDGASRGNPGESGAGALIKEHGGKTLVRLRRHLGVMTNNMAEYRALLLGLKEARELGAVSVRVFADSELIVKQIRGDYRVKSDSLKALYAEAANLVACFDSFSITHIPREKNAEADRLANEAIDGV